jgi:hypothetical protein
MCFRHFDTTANEKLARRAQSREDTRYNYGGVSPLLVTVFSLVSIDAIVFQNFTNERVTPSMHVSPSVSFLFFNPQRLPMSVEIQKFQGTMKIFHGIR